MSSKRFHLLLLSMATMTLSLFGAWGVRLALAGPSVPPPGNNVPPPLHSGDGWQYKLGKLSLGTRSAGGNNTLYVQGDIKASETIKAGTIRADRDVAVSRGGDLQADNNVMAGRLSTASQFCLPGTTAQGGGCIDKWNAQGVGSVTPVTGIEALKYRTTCAPNGGTCTITINNASNIFYCHTRWSGSTHDSSNDAGHFNQQEDWNPVSKIAGVTGNGYGWDSTGQMVVSKICSLNPNIVLNSLCSLEVVCERYTTDNSLIPPQSTDKIDTNKWIEQP